MSPTRRDIIKAAGGVAAVLALPQACAPIEPAIAAPDMSSGASAITYDLWTVINVSGERRDDHLYNRCLTFDFDQVGAVTIRVESPGRSEDTFAFQPGPDQSFAGVLNEIFDHMREQQRRIYADPQTIAAVATRRARRRAATVAEGYAR